MLRVAHALTVRSTMAIAMVFALAFPLHAEIYRWIDEAGTVHLDDDVTRVPEAQRDGARVFKTKIAPAPDVTGPTQGAFAAGITRALGLQTSDTQDPVSILQVVGIYPTTGWNPQAALSTAVVQDVADAARTAARAHRLRQSEFNAEAAVLQVSAGLGVAGPPPIAVAESAPPPPAAPPVVVAPNIIVEAPPPIIIEHREVQPAPVVSDYSTFAYGVPFAPLPFPRVLGPIPDRITPLSNPAGRLHGPLVQPLRAAPFTRPSEF
jgi:hypothetical protein